MATEPEVAMERMTEALSLSELEVVRRSLQAAVEGSFFPDWEFQTLMGVDRETVRAVFAAWPHQTIDHEDFRCAVVSSLNNLLGYPHNNEDELMTYVPEGRTAIRKALDQLVALGI
ncbi:hypothetical protein AAFG07_22060 [Bradyrhizobium sp. B097]|uniref:hypothetical protein n=1 Tax=Bradyrhizobium sp. B097 TaxID=3140244 RepID=UPI003182BDBC